MIVGWVGILSLNTLFFKWNPWQTQNIISEVNFDEIIILMLIRHIIQSFASPCVKCALGFKNIYKVQKISVLKSIFEILFVLFLFFAEDSLNLFLYKLIINMYHSKFFFLSTGLFG